MNIVRRVAPRFVRPQMSLAAAPRRAYSTSDAQLDDDRYVAPISYQKSIPNYSWALCGAVLGLVLVTQFQISATKKHLRSGHHGEHH